MRVRDLVKILKKCNQDAEVVINKDENGWYEPDQIVEYDNEFRGEDDIVSINYPE